MNTNSQHHNHTCIRMHTLVLLKFSGNYWLPCNASAFQLLIYGSFCLPFDDSLTVSRSELSAHVASPKMRNAPSSSVVEWQLLRAVFEQHILVLNQQNWAGCPGTVIINTASTSISRNFTIARRECTKYSLPVRLLRWKNELNLALILHSLMCCQAIQILIWNCNFLTVPPQWLIKPESAVKTLSTTKFHRWAFCCKNEIVDFKVNILQQEDQIVAVC